MIRLVLFAALIAVPIAEIAVFLTVGSAIGVLPTLALIIGTAILGAVLLRRQGLSAIARLRSDMDQGRVPAAAIGHALAITVAGILLLTPGFITDAVGFLLFVPAVRSGLWKSIAGSVKVHSMGGAMGDTDGPSPGGRPTRGGKTIDLDPDDYGPANDGSPWSNGGQDNDRRATS
ncbi:MAG: FxsA family protein [Pseudomonadota bacterium]